MVLQTIGSASILSSLNSGIRDFVLIGNLSRLPQCKELYPHLERIYDVRFIIPTFIEWSDETTHALLTTLAQSVTRRVYPLSTADRKYLHLSAVWACNFVNHCYDIAANILAAHHLPFDVMLPLIDETARKVHSLSPHDAQTGPAVRYDENVIAAQSALLADNPELRQLYELLSKSIHRQAKHM